MKKEYTTTDLFITSWDGLKKSPRKMARVVNLYNQLQATDPSDKQYGHCVITLLRLLEKNSKVVSQITKVEVFVDIFNDLKFLSKPFYFFPEIKGLPAPMDYMERSTFDHFIYADNEFSSYVSSLDGKHLRQLVATIYQEPFDRVAVQGIAEKLKVKEWQLQLVFHAYGHVREFVMNRCKTLLPPAPASVEEGESTPQSTGPMWIKLKHRLAETPAFQGFDVAGNANMYSTLDYLEDLAQIRANSKP